jgi:hypothetical protein
MINTHILRKRTQPKRTQANIVLTMVASTPSSGFLARKIYDPLGFTKACT